MDHQSLKEHLQQKALVGQGSESSNQKNFLCARRQLFTQDGCTKFYSLEARSGILPRDVKWYRVNEKKWVRVNKRGKINHCPTQSLLIYAILGGYIGGEHRGGRKRNHAWKKHTSAMWNTKSQQRMLMWHSRISMLAICILYVFLGVC